MQTDREQATAISQQKWKDSTMHGSPKILTPPDSPSLSSSESSENTLISISTTFFPGAQNHQSPSDLVLLSSDSVFFYAHSAALLAASQNSFNSLLPAESMTQDAEAIVPVADSSEVLNVVLHTIYNMSCSQYSPSLPTLFAAVSALTTYGVDLHTYINPSTPLFSVILAYAPASPLDVYALAAEHSLYDVAVSTSPHLLSFSLPTLSDDDAQRIGSVYLKRLFFLHLGRADALKRLLLPPPHPHAPTSDCDFVEQKKLTRAWALATAYLAWDARPDMPGSTLESALAPLGERLWCNQCRDALQERIRTLIVQWSVVKNYIVAYSQSSSAWLL